jgi:uroporphyrinogen decarboxylase
MLPEVKKYRDFFQMKPGAAIIQEEFGFFTLERWIEEKYISAETDLGKLFGYDKRAIVSLGGLGWCEAQFCPAFEEEVLEDRGEHEVVRDSAGRHVLVFKGRRSGFMPEYLDHPVKDFMSWEKLCKWRLDPNNAQRYEGLEDRMAPARALASQGYHVAQHLIGGYMYLRSLIGPAALLYMFYDNPGLIHDCMKAWFELADAVIARHQQHVVLDELYLAEDICYNHGLLISPEMMREFLFPYYRQLITNTKARQADSGRRLHLQIDTDGNALEAIDVYREIGMDYMSPFEVASGCDVVAIGRDYPDLLMRGGFDKRIIARGKDAIDREVDRIMPVMKARGGFIPTCDHGVPEEVQFQDYMHFRKRMLEFA